MFAKNGNVKYGFLTDFVLTQRRSFSQIILFSKSKFTVIYICINFIDFYKFDLVFWGDNSYYPIKFNIFLYIIPYNTVIFNLKPPKLHNF